MLLADLASYGEAQELAEQAYRDPHAWDRKAILNVAGAGKFSSDRTIRQYAEAIWRIHPCPVGTDPTP
jgi:starch phosphorylase